METKRKIMKITKEEYIERKNSINQKITELNNERSLLDKEYIRLNAPYNIGDIVIVNNSDRGIISGFKIDYSNNVCPTAKKIKKDGTASQHGLYIWNSSQVKLDK